MRSIRMINFVLNAGLNLSNDSLLVVRRGENPFLTLPPSPQEEGDTGGEVVKKLKSRLDYERGR